MIENSNTRRENKRKLLKMNVKTAELKTAFYEYRMSKHGVGNDAMLDADFLWKLIETALDPDSEFSNERCRVAVCSALERLESLKK